MNEKDFEKHNSKMIGLYNVLKKNMKSKFFRCLFANKTDYNVLFLQATRKTSSYRIKIKITYATFYFS